MEVRENLAKGAAELGVELSREALEMFAVYFRRLVDYNQKVNLTAITTAEGVAVKHFLDSLTCLSVCRPAEGASLVDVGTGAGFPGLPLKIVRPDLKVTLVDSLRKRMAFLEDLIQELGLPGIETVCCRAEELGRRPEHREAYDLAVARAVARLPVLCEYCLPLVRPGGVFLAMKGPEGGEEAGRALGAILKLGGELQRTPWFALPLGGDQRTIIVIDKKSPTPADFPRRPGVPEKRPLE